MKPQRFLLAAAVTILATVPALFPLQGCQKREEGKQAAPPQQAPAQPAPAGAGRQEAAPEVMSHIRQGLAYVATAKSARSGNVFEENIDNAIKEFSLAIEKGPNHADAYANRAVAYMQQKKFNKAAEDLKKARELNPDGATIRYNLASLYSLKGDIDLALDELDAALAKGFDNYDALRYDRDLANLRKHPEFKKILERHKVFIEK
jgi:tetratricopeptide (TPR) repeat protein